MKIGMVCSPTYGGSGVVATELGAFLAHRGHQVHFISIAMPFRLDVNANANLFFHEVQPINYPVLPGELYGLTIAGKTIQIAEDYGLDLVHAHYAIPHAISAWLAREAAPKANFRIISTLHGTDITLVGRSPSIYPLAKFAIEHADAVTTVSEWLRRETITEFGIQRPIDVLPNFVDAEKFRRAPSPACRKHHFAPQGEKVILHVSNFRPVKRIPDVIKAFALIRKEIPSKLLLVGDGPEREGAEQLAREMRLMQDVYFMGKQDHSESYFACADLMLFPSEYESFGLAALEAMAAENVVVASRGGGLPELIEPGVNGFLADVGDYQEMARLSVEILRDDERRKHMGKVARQMALEKYHPDIIIPQYEALYESVLEGRHAR